MSRFIWLVRREIWEHKAIWIAPLIVLACLVVTTLTTPLHLSEHVKLNGISELTGLSDEKIANLVLMAYSGLTIAMMVVMGIVSFFYSLDSLYADRRDRSVLFWKSLPLSDAETVLSKFTVASAVVPAVAFAAAVLALFAVAGTASIKLAMTGVSSGFLWHPQAILGGVMAALLWCVTAIFWYAPVVGYLMLASAWAPRGPFLWAVLPPVALMVLERILFYTEYVGGFIGDRLFGIVRALKPDAVDDPDPKTEAEVRQEIEKLADTDVFGNLGDFFMSPDLWLGVIAAALLIAAAMWVRRYRDENS